MADVVAFVPRVELDAQANMADFISLCKSQLNVFGQSLPFESDVWDLSDTIRPKAVRAAQRLVFSSLNKSRETTPNMMREPFKSFAKAYMRYQYGMRPTLGVARRMAALRVLEAALLEGGTTDAVHVTTHVLNRAVQMLTEQLSPSSAYQTANQLATVADFLCDSRLTATLTRWRHSLRRPPVDGTRVGAEFDRRRMQKLPSPAALDALPIVFRQANEPADMIVSSVSAILISAPDRINEVLMLPVDCETRQKRDGFKEADYGLRWWPAKGAEPMIKWIIPSMVEVVQAAVDKIRTVTADARDVATWYQANPTRLYLTAETEHLREREWLCMPDLGDVLFADPVGRTVAWRWCVENKILLHRQGRRAFVRFKDVEAAVLRMLPRGFPIVHPSTGLRYKDALCVIQRNALDAKKARYRCVIEPVTHLHIHNRLGSRSTTGIDSIFDRCGHYEPDGSPIRVNTHQFRHYLNTLAQAGGLSQLDIAKWSGRRDVRQNRHYDHETANAIVARIRTAVGDDTRMFGPLATEPRAALVTRDEFARLRVPTAHTTDFGYCVHDYVMSPCQMHRDCLNCGEQVCVKGEAEKERRVRQAHEEATLLLAMAEQAEAEGELGASEWIGYHRLQLARIVALLKILDDQTVPRGTIIWLTPIDIPSRLDQATEARTLLPMTGDDGFPQLPPMSEETNA